MIEQNAVAANRVQVPVRPCTGRGRIVAAALLAGVVLGVAIAVVAGAALGGGAMVPLALVGGLVLGAGATAIAGWTLMPGLMITKKPSTMGFDETVAALEKAVTDAGWSLKPTEDMNEQLEAHGFGCPHRVKAVRLCKAGYAKEVLTSDPYVATMMPCSFAVYEQNGEVYVATTNKGLMGKMFGGKIAEVMGGAVAADEDAMLNSVTDQ